MTFVVRSKASGKVFPVPKSFHFALPSFDHISNVLVLFSVKFFTSPFCHPLPIFKSSRRRLPKRFKTKNNMSHLPLATFCKILCSEEEVCSNQQGPVVGKTFVPDLNLQQSQFAVS